MICVTSLIPICDMTHLFGLAGELVETHTSKHLRELGLIPPHTHTSLPLSFPLSLPLSLSFSHPFPVPFSLLFSISLSISLSLGRVHALSFLLSLFRARARSLSLSLSLARAHTHSLSHKLPFCFFLFLSHTHTYSLPVELSSSRLFPLYLDFSLSLAFPRSFFSFSLARSLLLSRERLFFLIFSLSPTSYIRTRSIFCARFLCCLHAYMCVRVESFVFIFPQKTTHF